MAPVAGEFFQWAADNVDHNLSTIDGKNSIHIMGIIQTVTPSIGRCHDLSIRRKTNITTGDISTTSKTEIHNFQR